MTYGQLLSAIGARQVSSAVINEAASQAKVTLRGGQTATVTVPANDSSLALSLHRAGAGVAYSTTPPATTGAGGGHGLPLLPLALFPAVLMLGIGGFMILQQRRQNGPSSGGFGASSAGGSGLARHARVRKDAEGERPNDRFSDVAGCEEAVEELHEVLLFIQDPARFERLGAKMPSGVLLYGPPGTGKTLLARALAGESGMAYFALSASELVEMYVGVGAARVRDVFAKARKNAPALIFMDEIDAVGGTRGRGEAGGGGNDEREATLNQLLVELDGFSPRDNIIFLAATNRKELLDPALLRPGRLQNHIKVDLPGPKGRRDILALHTANKPLAEGIDLDRLAADTAGCSGADLSDMVNRAAILAARHDREAITMEDLDEGQLWAIAGPERKESVFGEGEERKVAFHEAGHVVCAEACDTHEKSHRVTIKQRGSAGGLAKYGQVDRILHDRRTLHEQMVCLLGGRAAEKEVFGEVSSGAQNDLQRVTQIGRAAVSELALSDAISQTVVNGERISEKRRALIEREVDALVTSAWVDAQQIVADHRESLDSLAEALLVQKDMHRVDILSALAGAPITPLPVPSAHTPAAQRPPTEPVRLSDRRRRSGVKERLGRADLRIPARRAIVALRGRRQAATR